MPVLSVLDLAPVSEGSTPADALRNSIELVRHVERLGYERHWVAEHHNMPGIARSAPAVLLAHLASATTTIRVGSGGVMLPNHASLAVAEQFGTLEALHPGRIDLGIGRAPGTDQLTAARCAASPFTEDEFPASWWSCSDTSPAASRGPPVPPHHRRAGLELSARPSGCSVRATTAPWRRLGMPFSFAHHFAAQGTDAAVAAYQEASGRRRPGRAVRDARRHGGVRRAMTRRSGCRVEPPAFVRLRGGRPGRFLAGGGGGV
jgi:luciferase family oxidoreductase group 1